MSSIELPMNMKPLVRSNVSRASLFSVLTSEQYAGKLNAVIERFQVDDGGKGKVYGIDDCFLEEINNIEVDTDTDNGLFKIFSHPYQKKKYAYIYKKINFKKVFLIEAKINYIQDSNALSSIKLILSDGEGNYMQNNRENNLHNELFISINPKGKLGFWSSFLEKGIVKKNVNVKDGIVLKIESTEFLEVKYSTDNINWVEIMRIDQNNFGKITEAGLLFEPCINPFFYDFFPSHLQLCCTSDTMIIAPHFESYERFFSVSLQSRHMPMDMINIKDRKIIDYFIELIEKGYYVNMGLNEYFIPDRSSYHVENYIHANFIYGVDKEKKVFKLMGFDTTLKYDEIDFDNFFSAIQKEIGPMAKINLYKYDSKGYPYEMNLALIVQMLRAYLNGERIVAVSSSRTITIDEKEPIVFGMKIFDRILEEEAFMEAFIYDRRIAFQIHEHIKIIMEMLRFLKNMNILIGDVYEQLFYKFKEAGNIAVVILNVIIKNNFSESDDIRSRLKKLVIKLKNSEREIITELINELRKQL